MAGSGPTQGAPCGGADNRRMGLQNSPPSNDKRVQTVALVAAGDNREHPLTEIDTEDDREMNGENQ